MTSATTQPPLTPGLMDWVHILRNAATTPENHPRYGEARQVVQLALQNIQGLNNRQNEADQPVTPTPGKLGGTAMNAFQGLTLGFGDEALGGLAGLATLATGGSLERANQRVQSTREGFNEQRGQFFAEHPGYAIGGQVYGTVINPLNRFLPAPTTALKGAVTGAILGGAQGLGEGEGTVKERLPSAGVGAVTGALSGAVLGKLVQKLAPVARGAFKTVTQLFRGKGLPPAQVQATTEMVVETAVRNRLQKDGYPPHVIEQLVQTMKRQGHIPTPPPPAIPIQTRPGETIMTKPPPDPLEAPAYQRRAKGVGGHSYSGTYPAGTTANVPGRAVPSAAGGPGRDLVAGQTAAIRQFLQGSTMADLPGKLESLRALGIDVPMGSNAEILRLILGGH